MANPVSPMTILRTALLVGLTAATAVAGDKTPPAYQHGLITGWTNRYYPSGFSGKHKFYELRGGGMIYQIGDCGAFQARHIAAGPTVDYSVDESAKKDQSV